MSTRDGPARREANCQATAVVQVCRERVVNGTRTSTTHYYLSSHAGTAAELAGFIRGHWGIESMHWVLDVTFREDESRTRERTLANNLSWLRRFAVTLLKRHPVKDSIRGKMLRCGYSTDFLTEVLSLNGV